MDRFTVCASPSIMDEYLRVIERMRSTQAQEAIADRWTAMLPKVCHMIPDQRLPRAVSRDPSDDKFITCAMAANAGYLVTGDRDLKTVPEELGFKIVSPSGPADCWAAPASFVVGIVTTMPPPHSLSRSKIGHGQIPITYALVNKSEA